MRTDATISSNDTQKFEINRAALYRLASRNQHPAIVENKPPDWKQQQNFSTPDVEPVIAQPRNGRHDVEIAIGMESDPTSLVRQFVRKKNPSAVDSQEWTALGFRVVEELWLDRLVQNTSNHAGKV